MEFVIAGRVDSIDSLGTSTSVGPRWARVWVEPNDPASYRSAVAVPMELAQGLALGDDVTITFKASR